MSGARFVDLMDHEIGEFTGGGLEETVPQKKKFKLGLFFHLSDKI